MIQVDNIAMVHVTLHGLCILGGPHLTSAKLIHVFCKVMYVVLIPSTTGLFS